jgi:DNA-binding XRE family transcriptional regulator
MNTFVIESEVIDVSVTVNTQKLNEVLYRKGLTRRAFAEKAGIGLATVVQICNGNRRPSAPVAKKIVDALDAEFDDLFQIIS